MDERELRIAVGAAIIAAFGVLRPFLMPHLMRFLDAIGYRSLTEQQQYRQQQKDTEEGRGGN